MNAPQLDRRQLAVLLATVPLAGLTGCASLSTTPTTSKEPARGELMDIHCHLFNASDLPAVRFLKIVFLHIYPHEAVSVLDINDPDALDGLIALMTWVLGRAKAPKAAQEIQVLDGLANSKSPAAQEIENAAAVQNAVAQYFIAKTAPVTVGGPPSPRGEGLMIAALLAASGEKRPANVGAPPLMSGAQRTAKKAYESKTNLGTYLRWFSLVTRYRYQLTDQLAADYARQGLAPRLLAPALVDYDKWLDEDVDRSPLPDQVSVMDRISRRPDGPAVHGYVAFDPLRQAYYNTQGLRAQANFDPLGLVQRAIKDSGFLGVKLYPPMGFKPINNAGTAQLYPDGVVNALGSGQVGAALDRALVGLYDLCTRLDAPILAHAGHSNGAGEEAAARADPAYWLEVFSRWPKLRVCLAHFGGFSTPSVAAPEGSSLPEASWEWTLGRHIADNPDSRVFADISYLAEVFAKPAARAVTAANIKTFVSRFDPLVEHLVFGSDWIMLGLEGGYPQYAGAVFDFFQSDCGFTPDQMQRLLYRNGARFLGLERDTPSFRRLSSYYARFGLPVSRLQRLAMPLSNKTPRGG